MSTHDEVENLGQPCSPPYPIGAIQTYQAFVFVTDADAYTGWGKKGGLPTD